MTQGFLNQYFGVGINIGRSLVQDNNPGITDNSPGKADELPLSYAKVNAPFGQDCVITFFQGHDEIVGANGLGGVNNVLIGSALIAIANVVPYVSGKQVGLLKHHAHLPYQGAAGNVPQVIPVHGYLASGYIGEPVYQSYQGTLAGAG